MRWHAGGAPATVTAYLQGKPVGAPGWVCASRFRSARRRGVRPAPDTTGERDAAATGREPAQSAAGGFFHDAAQIGGGRVGIAELAVVFADSAQNFSGP